MDYSLLLGVHYRAPHHLRPLASNRQNRLTDGLAIVAEGEFYLFFLKCFEHYYNNNDNNNNNSNSDNTNNNDKHDYYY